MNKENTKLMSFLCEVKNEGKKTQEMSVVDVAAIYAGLQDVFPEKRGDALKDLLGCKTGTIRIRIPNPKQAASIVNLWLMPVRDIMRICKRSGISADMSFDDLTALRAYVKQPLYGKLLTELFAG